jgi:hypothetical protein
LEGWVDLSDGGLCWRSGTDGEYACAFPASLEAWIAFSVVWVEVGCLPLYASAVLLLPSYIYYLYMPACWVGLQEWNRHAPFFSADFCVLRQAVAEPAM